ncbi:hypothetical protein Tco_0699166 [Tanacetum coccineum]
MNTLRRMVSKKSFLVSREEESIKYLFSFNTIIQQQQQQQQVSNPNDGNDNDEVFALSGRDEKVVTLEEDNEKKQEEDRLLDEEAKSLSHLLNGVYIPPPVPAPARFDMFLLLSCWYRIRNSSSKSKVAG